MCYTCTYSLCKVCIKQGKFFSVRGTKGFCDTCFGTILLIESKDENTTKVILSLIYTKYSIHLTTSHKHVPFPLGGVAVFIANLVIHSPPFFES